VGERKRWRFFKIFRVLMKFEEYVNEDDEN
jgi:hypothetical protein